MAAPEVLDPMLSLLAGSSGINVNAVAHLNPWSWLWPSARPEWTPPCVVPSCALSNPYGQETVCQLM